MHRQVKTHYMHMLLVLALVMPALAGCQDANDTEANSSQKPPKPVSTMTLRRSTPSFGRYTSATVAPWKAERIGFEQAGRVVEVIEPNEVVIPQTGGSASQTGTILARLDDERFRIAVETIEADIEVAERRLRTNQIAIQERLPAGIEAAKAELKLAERELQRSKKLSNAISMSELDTVQTRAKTARLQVASAEAELAQAEAEQQALKAQVRQSRQRMAEAQRNLRNSVLYSSFPGQVAETHAVPGTYAAAGDPIVTVLMMDPMVVEFETTAKSSRRYQRGDTLSLAVTDQLGSDRPLTGTVYTIDSVADPETRTFTVTLHVRNQKTSRSPVSSREIARTKAIFPLNVGSIVTGDDRLLVDQNAIHEIKGHQYVWKVTNRTSDKKNNVKDRLLTVQPLAIRTTGEKPISFLGKWNFVEVEFEDPAEVNLERDLITSQLYFNEGSSDENSLENGNVKEVLLEDEQWFLRAGDVARVALLPEESTEGFYVPMKAILNENGKKFVHAVEPGRTESVARRVNVTVADRKATVGESILLMIDSAGSQPLTEGTQIVVGGTHFLKDGDRVRVVPSPEAGR